MASIRAPAFVVDRLDELMRACAEHQVAELALFGSALREDYKPGRSDLDFVVRFKPMTPVMHKRAYFALLAELESLFGTYVDLVEVDAVRNPFVRKSIESSQEPLYAAA